MRHRRSLERGRQPLLPEPTAPRRRSTRVLVPGGKWQTLTLSPVVFAKRCNWTRQSRERGALLPPPSAVTCINAPLPTETGGTPVDGTYVISAVVAYGGSCTDAGSPTGAFFEGTLVFSGD